jgi:O-antigen/teichoic acid export membrane protein
MSDDEVASSPDLLGGTPRRAEPITRRARHAPAAGHRAPGRLRGHLGVPLFRSAYALVAATALTSVLGLVYWAVAARRYAEVDVGRGGAAIAALMLVGGASQLNLTNLLPRFLPEHGAHSRRLVVTAYGASTAAALVIGGSFVAFGGVDASLGGSGSPWPARVAFVVAVVIWNLFTLQDAVLAGIRRAVWVPIENGVFAVAKIALLFVLADAMPHAGLFASWTVPAALLALPVSIVVFTRLLPVHARATGHRQPPVRRDLLRYAGADYVGGLLQLTAINIMPLLVAALVGLEENAAFATAWVAASAFDLALVSIGVAFTVEGATDEEQIHRLARSTAKLSAGISVVGVVAIVTLAPTAMSMLGQGYAAGVDVLRILAVAMPFRAAVIVYLSLMRLRRRLVPIVAIQAVSCLTAVTLAVVLLPVRGITGAALAFAIAQVGVAVAIGPRLIRELRGTPPTGSSVQARIIT